MHNFTFGNTSTATDKGRQSVQESLISTTLDESYQLLNCAFTDKENWSDINKYNLAENLLFLIEIYSSTSDESLLNEVISIARKYADQLAAETNYINQSGLSKVHYELYQLTQQEYFFEYILSIIDNEEALTLDCGERELVIVQNLFTLLQLFESTNRTCILLRINLSIHKILDFSHFNSKGICWPNLYRLEIKPRQQTEQQLKLAFMTLYRYFRNDTFLFAFNCIATEKTKPGVDSNPSDYDLKMVPVEITDYPSISISKETLVQTILLNQFKRTIFLLRDRIPQQWQIYLGNRTEMQVASSFFEFVRFLLKTDQSLKPYLEPVFSIEYSAFKMRERLLKSKCAYLNNQATKTAILDLDDDAFRSLNLAIQVNIEIKDIEWLPLFKVHIFTLQNVMVRDEDYIAIKFDPIKKTIDEFIINGLTVALIYLFRKEIYLDKVIAFLYTLIEPDDAAETRSQLINRIKALIKMDWLIIKDIYPA